MTESLRVTGMVKASVRVYLVKDINLIRERLKRLKKEFQQ